MALLLWGEFAASAPPFAGRTRQGGFLRVYLKSQKEEKDESNVEKKWYNKRRRK